MKKTLLILFAGMFNLLLFSCYDDKGSYDYHEINEISISDWPDGGYTLLYLDTLRITPQVGVYVTDSPEAYIAFTRDDGNEERYQYIWEVEETNISYTETPYRGVIGTERDLVFPLTLEVGSYNLYFKIRDTETGILWFSSTTLTVQSSTDVGFLVLGEKEDGNVGLDMISFAAGDTLILRNLLDESGLPELQGPQRIIYTGPYMRNSYVWLCTESGSYYFDPTTMRSAPENTFDVFYMGTLDLPSPLVIKDISAKYRNNLSPATTYRMFITDDYLLVGMLNPSESYGTPINCYTNINPTYFKPYPYIFTSIGSRQGCYVVYDQDNREFGYFSNGLSQYVTRFGTDSDTPFPWKQPEGRELIYGENTFQNPGSYTYCFALLKDADNFYIYQFSPGSTPSKTQGYTFEKSKAPNLENATLFAFAAQRSLLLYADGSTLRAYDYAYDRSYSMEMDGEITCMKFDATGDNYDEIMIATYNDTEKGIVQRYALGSDLTKLDLTPFENDRWTGLVKVKDIEYKN